MEWKLLIVYSAIYLLLFVIVDIAYHKLKLSSEFTRKINHICSGLIALTFPLYFEDFISVIILCSLFLIILFTSKKLGLLQSINNVERKTKGSVFFPIIVGFCFFIYQYEQKYIFYYLPILILALCDPMASLVGKKLGFGTYYIFGSKKTFAGNLGFFFSCFIISYVSFLTSSSEMSLGAFITYPIIGALSMAFTCSVTEGISVNGYDNLSIPLVALGTLYTFNEIPFG